MVRQLSFFEIKYPYKYIIDASSIFTQKPGEIHRRTVDKSKWERIDKYITEKIIVTCSEIKDEVKDDELKKWLKNIRCLVLEIDDEIQENVIEIVTKFPNLLSFNDNGKSSGDAFLIATAMKYGLSVITEEKKGNNKIPNICDTYKISKHYRTL